MWNKRWVSIACVLFCGYFFPAVAFSELVFRTDDSAKWGSGKGSRLTMAEVDNNFWYLYNLLGMNVETYTATAGQTVFTTSFSFPSGSGYTAVYVNGVRQAPSAYTETNDTTITLSTPLNDGDVVQILYNEQTTLPLKTELASSDNGKGASMVSIEDSGSYFSASTVEAGLSELAQRTGVDLRLYASSGSGTLADPWVVSASDFDSAEAAGSLIYLPNGYYTGKNWAPDTGTRIVCQSENTVVKGASETKGLDDIFTTSSFTIRVQIIGGTWGWCRYVWSHTGNSALAYSRFYGMRIRDVSRGFSLSSAVGNVWEKVDFGSSTSSDNVGYGFYFDKSGSGQTNANVFRDCVFFYIQNAGIYIAAGSYGSFGNHVVNSWFEDSNGTGIIVDGNTTNLTVEGSFFESNIGGDIDLTHTAGNAINGITIANNDFAAIGTGQTFRIKFSGNSGGVVISNTAKVTPSVPLITADGGSSFDVFAHNNYLNNIGASDSYQNCLFSVGGTQVVHWSNYKNSGNVTGADAFEINRAGKIRDSIYTFITNDTTPSVVSGRVFKTANTGATTITSFDDGEEGQEIIVLIDDANTTIDCTGSTIVCNGGSDFTTGTGDVLTCINDGTDWRCTVADNSP